MSDGVIAVSIEILTKEGVEKFKRWLTIRLGLMLMNGDINTFSETTSFLYPRKEKLVTEPEEYITELRLIRMTDDVQSFEINYFARPKGIRLFESKWWFNILTNKAFLVMNGHRSSNHLFANADLKPFGDKVYVQGQLEAQA